MKLAVLLDTPPDRYLLWNQLPSDSSHFNKSLEVALAAFAHCHQLMISRTWPHSLVIHKFTPSSVRY